MSQQVQKIAQDYLTKYKNAPSQWASEVLDVDLWSKQREILDSVFQNRRTFVRASYSVGKTYVAAVAILAFLFLRMPSKVITVAPTFRQVKDLLWSEINTLYKTRLEPQGFPGIPLTTRMKIEGRDDWFGIGLSPRDDVNIQGFHQKNVLVVVDESPGVRPQVIDALEGLMSSGDCHMLHIGNPIGASDHFYKGFKDPDVESKFRISAFDTPAFTGEKVSAELLNVLVSKEWVEERKKKWGVGSPLYQSKVEADFPTESERQLIPLSLCEAAKVREVSTEGKKELGVDVALYGDDKTVYTMLEGQAITGIRFDTKRDTMYVAGRIAKIHKDEGFDKAKVDVIGIGSGVVARCRELGLPVVGVDVRERAVNCEEYFNLRTELWFVMKEWLKTGKLPDDDELIADLVAPHYEYRSDGRYQLELKAITKKRLGRSPDYGDSAVLSTAQVDYISPEIYTTSTSMSVDRLMRQLAVS